MISIFALTTACIATAFAVNQLIGLVRTVREIRQAGEEMGRKNGR